MKLAGSAATSTLYKRSTHLILILSSVFFFGGGANLYIMLNLFFPKMMKIYDLQMNNDMIGKLWSFFFFFFC